MIFEVELGIEKNTKVLNGWNSVIICHYGQFVDAGRFVLTKIVVVDKNVKICWSLRVRNEKIFGFVRVK